MKREWKPGDVADFGSIVAMRTIEGWAYPDGSVGGLHQDTYPARPLVVIDPEDREQVGRLLNAIRPGAMGGLSQLQAALCSLIEPPKPEEPTGLGAVVEDADGADWHRTRDGRWIAEDGLRSRAAGWVHIKAVRVLSEGVTP